MPRAVSRLLAIFRWMAFTAVAHTELSGAQLLAVNPSRLTEPQGASTLPISTDLPSSHTNIRPFTVFSMTIWNSRTGVAADAAAAKARSASATIAAMRKALIVRPPNTV
jgi:hypothetical protein